MGQQKALELEHARDRILFDKITWIAFSIYLALLVLQWKEIIEPVLTLPSYVILGFMWLYFVKNIFEDLKDVEDSIREV